MYSIKEVKERIRKPTRDNLFTELFLRKVSFPVTYFFVHTPLTANQITILGIITSVIASYLLSTGRYSGALIGSFLCFFAYIFDCVDGEMARFKKLSSETGSFLDDVSYLFIEFLPIIGITFGVYNNNPSILVFAAGFLALFSIMFQRIMIYRRYQTLSEFLLKGKKSKYPRHDSNATGKRSKLSYVKSALELIFTLRGYIAIMIILAILDMMEVFLYFYAIAYFSYLLFHLWYQHNYGFEKFLHRSLPKE
jgi:phosphatidylglycerophosphate synthase